MSRYQAMCVAIELCESARRLFQDGSKEKETASEVIGELQDVARDVRYGGKWEGDYESIAQALGYCTEIGCSIIGCSICPYRKEIDCRQQLKRDAMHAIRAMGARLKEQQAEIERQIKEKHRAIEQIENEINRLHKESRNVKDEV